MADMKAGVLLSLKDLFSPGMKGAGLSARDFGKTALGAVEQINKAFSGLAGTLGTLGVTIGVGAAVKTYIDLDERMVRIGTDIGASAEKTNELKRSLYEVAQDPAIKMGTDALLAAMETFASKNYDADFIKDNLRDVGLLMKAAGVTGEEAAGLFIESYKRGMSKEELIKSLDDMSVIGDTLRNEFNLSEFTRYLSGLEAVNHLLGKSAMSTTELFTAMNVLGAGTKSPARAVAAYTAVVNELADPRKQELLWNLGIAVREGGTGDFRNLADILKEIAATDLGTGNFDTLSTVFSAAAMDAIFAYHEFGHVADGLKNLGDTSGEIANKAGSNAQSIASNLQNLQTAFMSFADKSLTGPLEKITGYLNKLAEDPERVESNIRRITVALGALALIKIGAGVASFIANLKTIQGGKIDLAGSAGGAGIPVHVTNWGGTGGMTGDPSLSQHGMGALRRTRSSERRQTRHNGQPTTPPSAGSPTATPPSRPRFGITKQQAAVTGGTAAVTAAVFAIPDMMRELDAIKQDETLTDKERGKATGGAIGGAVGSIGGAAAGAVAGAAIGSVVPIVGTALGALAGGLIGYFGGKGGRLIGEKIGEAVTAERQSGGAAVPAADAPAATHYDYNAFPFSSRDALPREIRDELAAITRLPQGSETPVVEGTAKLENHLYLYDNRTEAQSFVKYNTTPFQFPTGAVSVVREGTL